MATPISERQAVSVTSLGGFIYGGAGAAGVAVWAIASDEMERPALTLAASLIAIGAAATLWSLRRRPGVLHRHFGLALWLLQTLTPPAITMSLIGTGPQMQLAASLYVTVTIYSAFLLRPAFVLLSLGWVIANFAVVVYAQDGWHSPTAQVLFLAASLVSASLAFGIMIRKGNEEVSRLSGFRRFLPETVANAVVAAGEGDLFEPHRRAITVVFCDLRGFTHFASMASPEDIQDVLNAYFGIVGKHLNELGATVGAIQGDGVMAYFGDPLPVDDPNDRAIEFATRLRTPMAELVRGWNARGFGLGWGVGIARGYATLGVVGFDGRSDYTALGPVVNLASRLSDVAGPGETLLDQRTIAEAVDPPETAERSVALKGYDAPVAVHVLA